MDRMQLAGRSWQFKLRSLNELLITTIQQPRYFATHQDSWRLGIRDRRTRVVRGNQHRRSPMLADQYTSCDPRKTRNIKRVGAQRIKNLFKALVVGLLGHGRFPSNLNEGNAAISPTPISHTRSAARHLWTPTHQSRQPVPRRSARLLQIASAIRRSSASTTSSAIFPESRSLAKRSGITRAAVLKIAPQQPWCATLANAACSRPAKPCSTPPAATPALRWPCSAQPLAFQ